MTEVCYREADKPDGDAPETSEAVGVFLHLEGANIFVRVTAKTYTGQDWTFRIPANNEHDLKLAKELFSLDVYVRTAAIVTGLHEQRRAQAIDLAERELATATERLRRLKTGEMPVMAGPNGAFSAQTVAAVKT